MSIKIKVDGKKLVPCKKCGVFHKSRGKKKKTVICPRCTQEPSLV